MSDSQVRTNPPRPAQQRPLRVSHAVVTLLLVSGCLSDAPPPRPVLETADVKVLPANGQPTAEKNETPTQTEPDSTAHNEREPRDSAAVKTVANAAIPKPIEVPPAVVLAEAGLRRIDTTYATIVTDLADAEVAILLPCADQIWPALQRRFGNLPASITLEPRPLTAFVVSDESTFIRAGVLKGELPKNIHGRHAGWQFWMRWPQASYYQRHLFAHEAAHCYSMIQQPALPAGWLEALAEWFATHRVSNGDYEYGVIPESPSASRGWGRIELLRQDIDRGVKYSAADVSQLNANEFQGVPSAYAWAWALAAVLEVAQPETFAQLRTKTTRAECSEAEVVAVCQKLDESGIWQWWLESLEYGHVGADALPAVKSEFPIRVHAAAGWQAAAEQLAAGTLVQLEATGTVSLTNRSPVWTSTADGLRADYVDGIPIGTLLVRTLSETGQWSPSVPIGAAGTYRLPANGRLYFRVNDDWSKLADNAGELTVGLASTADE